MQIDVIREELKPAPLPPVKEVHIVLSPREVAALRSHIACVSYKGTAGPALLYELWYRLAGI